jgi:cell division protein FtsN
LNIADRLKTLFQYVEVVPVKTVSGKGGTLFRVRVSRSKTLDQANSVKDRLRRIGFEEAFVVSL